MRARSKRRGEASFRKTEQGGTGGVANPDLTRQNSQSFQFQNHQNLQQECLKHRNQRWVHLPLTICEALREFSCFFPCRSSCMSSEREKEKGGVGVRVGGGGSGEGHGREGSCGAAFARWLVALQDGDGKGRGIELVMEEEEEEEEEEENDGGREKAERSYSQRRHVFEDIDIDLVEGKKHEEELVGGGEEEEKARVSICIPPKNALLLMRCRSDPVKMAALANRFWESPVHKDQLGDQDEDEEHSADEDDDKDEEECNKNLHIQTKEDKEQVRRETNEEIICERKEAEQDEEESATTFPEEQEAKQEVKESYEVQNPETNDEEEKEGEANGNAINIDKGEAFSCHALPEVHSDLEKPEKGIHLQEHKEKENEESSELSSSPETFTASEPQNKEAKAGPEEQEEAEPMAETSEEGSTEEDEKEHPPQETDPTLNPSPESKEREKGSKKEERERETLPECLLLMMCEPKLSMEVSKETWVCSTDFIRWLPERPAGKNDGAGALRRVGVDNVFTKPKSKPSAPPPQPLMQPPRSSCSFPAAGGVAGMSMATMIEQKLVGAKSGNGYEPFVLTRCKSEPMRSSAKLAPEACFWNNRKLEPHPPPAQLGVGAPAGVGF